MLINYLRGMKRRARGAQELRHTRKYAEAASDAQRANSPAQATNQPFPWICLYILVEKSGEGVKRERKLMKYPNWHDN